MNILIGQFFRSSNKKFKWICYSRAGLKNYSPRDVIKYSRDSWSKVTLCGIFFQSHFHILASEPGVKKVIRQDCNCNLRMNYNYRYDAGCSLSSIPSKRPRIPIESIPDWEEYALSKGKVEFHMEGPKFPKNVELNKRVSIYVGDITVLELDAIVNAANSSLRGGGGVDGAIHNAAGPGLLEECIKLNGCETGQAKLTGGHNLPAKHVIHTVGPIGIQPEKLKACYVNCLNLAKENELQNIAFPCISTGVYGYPNEKAAHVAIKTVREWLEANIDSVVKRVIFCLFLEKDVKVYTNYMHHYFPAFEERKAGKS